MPRKPLADKGWTVRCDWLPTGKRIHSLAVLRVVSVGMLDAMAYAGATAGYFPRELRTRTPWGGAVCGVRCSRLYRLLFLLLYR